MSSKRIMPSTAILQYGWPRLTVARVQRWLESGALSSVDLCSYCYALAVAGETKYQLGAFARLVDRDVVLDQARASDERRQQQRRRLSAVDGVPVSIKANLAMSFQPLTAGSRILGASFIDSVDADTNSAAASSAAPIGYHADVTQRLLDCGAVIIGSTSMDEFGMGSLGLRVATHDGSHQMTRNPRPWLVARTQQGSEMDEIALQCIRQPHDAILEAHATIAAFQTHDQVNYSAGGSSSGSAVSVAHGSSLLSVGSDTGGSVRLPAAWCGVIGLKPTYGLLSRHGLVAYASSLDTIGILARSVACAATALDCLLPFDRDSDGARSTTAVVRDANQQSPAKPTDFAMSIRNIATTTAATVEHDGVALSRQAQESQHLSSQTLSGLRVGIPAALSISECPSAVITAWSAGAAWLAQHGAVIEAVPTSRLDPLLIQASLSAYYILASAEASSNLSRYDGLRYGWAAPLKTRNAETSNEDKTSTSTFSVLEQQYAATRALGFGPEVIRRILCGTAALSSDRFHTHYEGAAKLRATLIQQLSQTLRNSDSASTTTEPQDEAMLIEQNVFDLLLFPTTLFPPPVESDCANPTETFANDIMTVPISLAGLPAISVPFGRWDHDNGLFQIGLQLVAPRFGEANLLRAAAVLGIAESAAQAAPAVD
jgi:aspartyl-tRNA(Asn)/glutamyl-tRNA(Gln) amidotransferase subunit A